MAITNFRKDEPQDNLDHLMCQAHGCPNRWSVDRGSRLCSAHAWEEPHKWQKVATGMGISQKDLTTRLKTIISRRNQIVHEADLDMTTGDRNTITKSDIDFVVDVTEVAKMVQPETDKLLKDL